MFDVDSFREFLHLFNEIVITKDAQYIVDDSTSRTIISFLKLNPGFVVRGGGYAIRKALESSIYPTRLRICFGDGFRDEEVKCVIDVLKYNTTLTSLSLAENHIGDESVKYIADALQSNMTLTSLDLSGNQIGPEDAKYIADALKTNKTLTSLNLSFNYISNEGAKYIADTLGFNTTLTSLNLISSRIEAEGAKSIVNALKNNTTLTSLNLPVNKCKDMPIDELGEIQIVRPKINFYIEIKWIKPYQRAVETFTQIYTDPSNELSKLTEDLVIEIITKTYNIKEKLLRKYTYLNL